jgi:hypothetical protein
MRVTIHSVLLLVGAPLLVAVPCTAQTKVDITPFVGVGVYPLTTFSSGVNVFCALGAVSCGLPSFDVSPTTGVAVGARLTSRLTKRLMVDFSVAGWGAHGSTAWAASPGLQFDTSSRRLITSHCLSWAACRSPLWEARVPLQAWWERLTLRCLPRPFGARFSGRALASRLRLRSRFAWRQRTTSTSSRTWEVRCLVQQASTRWSFRWGRR